MALLKGKRSFLRYLGFIAAIFASIQALVWIGMSVSGIICFYTNCGVSQPANRFGKAFNNIYLSTKLSMHYPHIITPIFFHVLLWIFVIVSAVWLFASVSLIVDYRKWTNAKRLRKSSKRWVIVTIIVCVLDLLLFVLFVVDFSMLKTGNIEASVRSMDVQDYEGENVDVRPYESHNPFDEYYDGESSERNPVDNSTFPGAGAFPQERGVTSDGPNTPSLSFEERLHRIEENLARRNADVDKRLENLLAKAELIRQTELRTHYNPYVRLKVAKLMDELAALEKQFTERDMTEDERNKMEILALKKKIQEQMATSTELAPTEAEEATSDDANVRVTDEDYSSHDEYQSDQQEEDDLEEKLNSSDNARRNFERVWKRIKERMKFSDDAEKVNETMQDFGGAARIETDNLGEMQANSGDEYNDIWRSTVQDEDYGIILQNDGPGTGWRKISTVNEGSATGSDVMLAPSAVLITLAIRGYVLWITNLSAALMLLYLYITRPRRPTLITRVQA